MVMDSNMVSDDIWSSCGVAAGSPHATFETAAYLLMTIRRYCALFPEVKVTVFVDDITITADGTNERQLVDQAVGAAEALASTLRSSLGPPVGRRQAHGLRHVAGACPAGRVRARQAQSC